MNSVLDFDDVIFDFHSAYLEYAKNSLGITMDMTNHTGYDFYRQYGISEQEFLDHICSDHFCTMGRPFENAKRSIDKLRAIGSRIIIVTARGYMENANQFVSGLLEANEIRTDEIIVPASGISKSAYYQKFGKIDLFIDDATHNIEDAIRSRTVENMYLINKPWNQSYGVNDERVTRAQNIEIAIDLYLTKRQQ